jgi:hypothetical protein
VCKTLIYGIGKWEWNGKGKGMEREWKIEGMRTIVNGAMKRNI